MKSQHYIIIFYFLLFLSGQTVNAIDHLENVCIPKITYFDKTVYNAANQTWAIAQNKKGYMYFANSGGLLEYDGSQWTLYTLPGNTTFIRSIAITDDQKIYTGIRNESGTEIRNEFGFWAEDLYTRKLKYTSLSEATNLRFSDEEIWKIIPFKEDVYFQSFKNIYKYNTRNKSISIIPAPTRFQFIFKVKDKLFAQDKALGLMELKDDRLSGVPGGNIFTGDCIYGMVPYKDNSVLIATIDRGLFLMRGNGIQQSNFHCNDFLIKNQIFSMISLPEGKFAFGTILNGLLITDHNGNILSSINKPKGMSNNTVLSIFSDQTNNIWLGLDRGISHIQINSPIRTFPDPKGSLGSVYQAEVFDERLYFATNQGLFYCLLSDLAHPERELQIHLMPKSQGQVWSLQIAGNRLLCGHNKGVYVVEKNQGNFVYTKSGVTRWLYINDKTLLLLSYNGLCTMHLDESKYTFKEHSVYPYDGRCLAKDKNNNIYVGSISSGYYKVTFDSNYDNVLYSTDQLTSIGINQRSTNGIFTYKDNLYAVDVEKGISKLDDNTGRFLPVQVINNLLPPNEDILRLQLDKNDMWCYTNNRFFLIKNYNSVKPVLIEYNMQSLYKQLVNSFEHIKKISDNSYMVCTSNSFAVLNTNYAKKIKQNKVYFRDIGFFVDSLESLPLPHLLDYYKDQSMEIPFNNKTLYIRFTLPDYENEGNIRYSFRLKGNSNNYSIPSVNNIATFTNLPAGNYIFQVKATVAGSNDIYYSQDLHIRILPPWYLGWIGICLVLLLSTGIVFLYYKYLQYRWRKKQRRLLYEHEKEMSKMENRLLQEQIKSQADELEHVTKSMLYKNKLMQKIDTEMIKLTQSKTILQSDLKELKNIVELNKNPIEEWQLFEKNFNKTHDNYLVKLSCQFSGLTPSDLKLAAYIRMNISSKEIAGLMNISPKSIEMARYRLRKKIGLTRDQSLAEFLMTF